MQTHLGMSGTAFSWFRSYMCERTQHVMIGSDWSADFPLRFGAPERSVLGPALFTVSTAPLQILTKKHCVQQHKSADDLQVYVTDSPNLPHARERTVKQLTDFIDDVVPWMISGKLKLNGMKTEFLVLLSPQQLKKYGRSENIAVDGAVIRPVVLVRNLGAWHPFRHPSLNVEPGYRYLQEVQLPPPIALHPPEPTSRELCVRDWSLLWWSPTWTTATLCRYTSLDIY